MGSRRVVAAIAAVAGLLLVAVLASRSLPRASTESAPSSTEPTIGARSGQPAGAVELPREYGPLLMGEPVSLAEAESMAGAHIPRPDSPMANDSTVRKVFYEKRSTDDGSESYIVAIDYEAGLVAYVHPASYDGDIFKNPGAAYARTADGLNAAVKTPIATVDTVLAAPALVIERSASGVASVDVVLSNGFRVQLIAEYAPDMDVSTVKEIAESVK